MIDSGTPSRAGAPPPAASPRDEHSARLPLLERLIGVVALKTVDGLLLGTFVIVCLLIVEGGVHLFEEHAHDRGRVGRFIDAIDRFGADLLLRYRANPGLYSPRLGQNPIIVVAARKADEGYWTAQGPGDELHRIVDFISGQGPAVIVVDSLVRPGALPDCAPQAAAPPEQPPSPGPRNFLCGAHPVPVVVARDVSPVTKVAGDAPAVHVDIQQQQVRACPPNVWFGNVFNRRDPSDGFRRRMWPWVWMPRQWPLPAGIHLPSFWPADAHGQAPAGTGHLADMVALPAIELLAVQLAASRAGGDALAALANLRGAYAPACPQLQEARSDWFNDLRIGPSGGWRSDRAVPWRRIAYEFGAPDAFGIDQAMLSYGQFAHNQSLYRVLPFPDVLAAAEACGARPGARACLPDTYRNAIVVIGDIDAPGDTRGTPLGALSGPIVIANAIHSLQVVGLPDDLDIIGFMFNLATELAVVAATATIFAVMFWPPIWYWPEFNSRLQVATPQSYKTSVVVAIAAVATAALALWWYLHLPIPAVILAALLLPLASHCLEIHRARSASPLRDRILEVIRFAALSASGLMWLACTIYAAFWAVDALVVETRRATIDAAGAVNFVLPASLIALKGIVEASELFVAGMTRGSVAILDSTALRQAVRQAHDDLTAHDAHGGGAAR